MILFIVIILLLILKKNELFLDNSYTQHLQPYIKNKSKLISRIRTIEKGLNYSRNTNIFIKSRTICILVEDLKYFIDNHLTKIKPDTILKICDHPLRSVCNSTFNYKNFLNNKNIKKIYAENWKDKLHLKLVIIPGFESLNK